MSNQQEERHRSGALPAHAKLTPMSAPSQCRIFAWTKRRMRHRHELLASNAGAITASRCAPRTLGISPGELKQYAGRRIVDELIRRRELVMAATVALFLEYEAALTRPE